ncbi:YjjG family noncanonical pyrimidine nucleotidase [Bacillus haynesii]|uniref:YjjG family noncanonical pyrimidine nucleotidase n=1 Tax=Bacillus haynesii TaxID=1925021 RepID=UPI0012BA0528|nr:YjjG family noncanonical pyrimidine nucleotidase [Bacillus haynesii]TWK27482.1 putative HAD-hydrolase YfnB [Bacillus licheniformis]MCY7844375.1 YjjG family noncanonical pyrimidine nucleotidase [Bacillus haynesii]MCY8017743.1 YjjG family noncanonical pyrimidine nucleotidase [Bacillus haynesii]MCY8144043.1 YjjG family noncanonical pyrimidine nucleotidase [Bacillus haynesii]MCY8215914.1 YjjG family noncanonical pyrimidine nucleotidase [Bacillus haynesii]
MKNYRTLFFDVDDTLLDFGAAEKSALRKLFEEQQISLTAEIEANYKRINQGLWRVFEKGEIDRDQVVNTRFSILFKEYGLEADGVLLEEKYRSFLEEGHQLIDGAFELIKSMQDQYDLYIVTNGISKTQYKRLHASGLYPMFKGIFVSEDTGFQKPMKEYFDYVFERIPHFSVDQGLIIGDSLTADIKGGRLAGLDTCWMNPDMSANDTDIEPTYQIQRLNELQHILNHGKIPSA